MRFLTDWGCNFEMLRKKCLLKFRVWEKENLTIIHGKRHWNAEETYGLAYTSCGEFAGMWNTNCMAVDKSCRRFQGLALSEDNDIYAVMTDGSENYTYEEIGGIV